MTGILKAWSGGDTSALERLTPIVNAELHRLARISMSRERNGHLMQPSALVNEASVRLIGGARDIYIKNASGIGKEELVTASKIPKNKEDWSADGRWMVFNEAVPNSGDDLVMLPPATRKPQDFLRTRFHEDAGRFSPDGK